MDSVTAALIGASIPTFVSGVFGVVMWRLQRKAVLRDRKVISVEMYQSDRDSVFAGLREILYNTIKHLAQKYIERGWISVEELEDLERMHKIYHTDLEGNGFLDGLMATVRSLPKKKPDFRERKEK